MEEENEGGKPRLKPLQTVGTAAVMAAMAIAFFAVVFCIFAGLEWLVLSVGGDIDG